MDSYFKSLCEVMNCDKCAFNMPLLKSISIMALESTTPVSYVIDGNQLTNVRTAFSGSKIIVLPMFGLNCGAIGNVESEFSATVKPRPDGARMSCFMLANDTVALDSMIPHWADVSLDDEFHVLWLFDDEAYLSTHYLNDDLRDQMQIADAIAEDHKPLTQEEVQAWKNVAAHADYIGIFDYVDLCAQ